MASPSSVLTEGFGSWGSVNLIITLGYGISQAVAAPAEITLIVPGVVRTLTVGNALRTLTVPGVVRTLVVPDPE